MLPNIMLFLATSVSYSLMLFSCVYPQPAATSRLHHNNYTDLESLLAFKSQVADPLGVLATNWTAKTPFCEWVGVRCSNPRHQRVTSLNFYAAPLHGIISPHLGNLSFLSYLNITNCYLTGPIPNTLTRLHRLTELFLGGNQLSGPIPTSFGNLTDLEAVDLSWNNLTGTIPDELGSLLKLQFLQLEKNNLSGSIPISLLNTSKLRYLHIAFNMISGPIPTAIGESMPLLIQLCLGSNHLTGGLDFITSLSNCKALQTLDFTMNEFEGVLPASIGNLSKQLQNFGGGLNRIRGNIPREVGNLSGLLSLDLEVNELNGPIPLELRKLEGLQALFLCCNDLSGPIPHELSQLKSLDELSLSVNKLSGPIPDSFGNLTKVEQLELYRNSLSSNIPQSLCNLKDLVMLNLGDNLFSGTLPLDMDYLEALNKLYLQDNQLSGEIPNALGKLQMLSFLDLSNNTFSGQIPQSLGNITNIEYMNLSHNFLSGSIPKSIATLRHLNKLDLCFNNLEGQIPDGGVFSNLTIPSLQGNKALCGAHPLGFPPCLEKMRNSTFTKRMQLITYIIISIASALVLLACLYFLSKSLRGREKKDLSPIDTQWLTTYRSISYEELVRATKNFGEQNLLGRGSCSSVFKACLDDGTITALKVIDLASEGASKSFDVECQALSTVRHKNLVKIITTCSNFDFKSIVLQFMQNGSLDKWLYSNDLFVNLLQRIQIMVDVALALEYLHHHHTHVIVHCDLKPSNVLLDENMVAHVGDFGIAKLFHGDSAIALSTNAQGTIGYMAPEYGLIGKVSRKGDVYSFGILLLETFTRKKPSNSMFNEELNLRQWVRNAHPLRVMEIVDDGILGEDFIQEKTPEFLTNIQQCLSSVIEVGLMCSAESPKERISMKDVVPRLQKIKLKYLASLHNA